MKAASIFATICLCLLAACRTGKQVESTRESPKPAVSDDFKIEQAVYGYLLEKHPWGDGEYAAIFLTGDDARTSALIKQLPKQVPPLKPVSHARQRPDEAPIDRDTGKPGMLLTAKAVDPTNGVSEAVGTWYGGEAASGLYAFVLVEMNGEWTIQSAK